MTARVGVLGLQGDFAEHLETLRGIGAEGIDVRRPEQLDGLDALIIPGGESTTITRLLDIYELREPIRAASVASDATVSPAPATASGRERRTRAITRIALA